MRVWNGAPLPAGLRARLQQEVDLAKFLHAKILELQRERYAAIKHERSETMDKVRTLRRYCRGIGNNCAWVYVNEFFGWREFANRKQLGAAAGLRHRRPTKAEVLPANKGLVKPAAGTFAQWLLRRPGVGCGFNLRAN